jgi:hypothetical protein
MTDRRGHPMTHIILRPRGTHYAAKARPAARGFLL